jgi:hypothetical protein
MVVRPLGSGYTRRIFSTIPASIWGCEKKEGIDMEFKKGDKVKFVKIDAESELFNEYKMKYFNKIGTIVNDKPWPGRQNVVTVNFEDKNAFVKNCMLDARWLKREFWTGKIVCTYSDNNYYFEKGKIYTVRDGILIDNIGYRMYRMSGMGFESERYLNCPKHIYAAFDRAQYDFIEFKGFADEGKDKNE